MSEGTAVCAIEPSEHTIIERCFMYSVLEKTKQETVVPALKLSVPIEKESGFLVIESEIPKQTVDEVALVPATFIKKESSFL